MPYLQRECNTIGKKIINLPFLSHNPPLFIPYFQYTQKLYV
ncbi:hypothetical protein HMPREF3182_01424 [Megasphaera hutchinsoni]|uniref:Uncharacterized protein n=1 Tax=Megasphaera hutchinsoni TaxID=1588748 RepID=A0A134CD15_9FIRM|nr:hypothetical protein HMPREF3182_01424 [Megasphaera hutchinsoni]